MTLVWKKFGDASTVKADYIGMASLSGITGFRLPSTKEMRVKVVIEKHASYRDTPYKIGVALGGDSLTTGIMPREEGFKSLKAAKAYVETAIEMGTHPLIPPYVRPY